MKMLSEKALKVLELQEQGVSIEEIIKKLGYKDNKSLNRLMNKNNYSCKKGIYVPKEEDKPVENAEFERLELHMARITKAIQETQELLKEEISKEDVKKGLVIEPRELKLKATSIRIDETVSNKFEFKYITC